MRTTACPEGCTGAVAEGASWLQLGAAPLQAVPWRSVPRCAAVWLGPAYRQAGRCNAGSSFPGCRRMRLA